jgi:radical SAM superfamily enzyme YgiQ (UPF0313 family)
MPANLPLNPAARTRQRVTPACFPSADDIVAARPEPRPAGAVDVLFVNPPAPDGGIWIRSQHRVGRRSREGMIWPQVSLAQMAALLPDYSVAIIDAIATRMTWAAFETELRRFRPRFYVTQVTGPTLQNDMYGAFLARSLGATTMAFGTHVTPLPRQTMAAYPALDYVIRGEPEETLRELVAACQTATAAGADGPRPCAPPSPQSILGLVWRHGDEIVVNPDRPFMESLDSLPVPRHDLLPLARYSAPLMGGPYTFVVTSRGCPGGCRFCIKHASYQESVRFRSPEHIMQELRFLDELGVHRVNMYADLFTVNRDQVMGLCQAILDEGLKLRWTCNSRVDFVDPEMLERMRRAGCFLISWGIESASQAILDRVHKGIDRQKVERALGWSRDAGIKNWGYFIIGLPGETEDTIRETIAFAKRLPLHLALFHIAAPYPGTPFFFEALEQGWFRAGARWEEVDMDESTVLDYPGLSAERVQYWARRAAREWSLRPGPVLTYAGMLTQPETWRAALEVGRQYIGWMKA